MTTARYLVLLSGVLVFGIGITPMLGALAVANKLIDDGPDESDEAIMSEWN